MSQGFPVNFELEFLPSPSAILPNSGKEPMCVFVETHAGRNRIHGWALPANPGDAIRGIRARQGKSVISARRRQVRTDIAARFPQRPEALTSGFFLDLELPTGLSTIILESRLENSKQWHGLCKIIFRRTWRAMLVHRLQSGRLHFLSRPLAKPLERAACPHPSTKENQATPSDHSFARSPCGGYTPEVSIIIPTKDRVDLLSRAVGSLFQVTDYAGFELIIVDHDSFLEETHRFLDHLTGSKDNVVVVRAGGDFNWSRLNNLAAARARGEVLIFLNNDVEVVNTHWLRALVSPLQDKLIGAVGARLDYPDGRIQHVGVILGLCGVAGHVFRGMSPLENSLAGLPATTREVAAVTGACLAVRKKDFFDHGGFDESLPVAYNDVDFCLRLRQSGLRIICQADCHLVHHESASRQHHETSPARKQAATQEAERLFNKWGRLIAEDPFYDKKLSRFSEQPALRVGITTQGTTVGKLEIMRWPVSR